MKSNTGLIGKPVCRGWNRAGAVIMHVLRVLRQCSMRFANRAAALCRGVGMALRRWQQQQLLDAQEGERLDRIRNPSKYLGKP